MKTKSYYLQLKEKVLPHLTHFKEDLTKHDKKALRGYKKAFIHGARETGTDLFFMDQEIYINYKTLQDLENALQWDEDFLLRDLNKIYHYGLNNQVTKISKDEARKIFNTFKNGMIQHLKEEIKEQQQGQKVA
jgi:hypothetical protein